MGFSRQEYWSGVPSPSPKSSLLVGKICTAQGPLSDSPPPHVHNLLSSLSLLWGHPGLSSRLKVSCWWLLWLVSVQAILLITYFQCLCYRMRLDMVILICRWRTRSLRQYGRLSFPKLAPIIVPSTHALPEPRHFPIRVGIHLPSPRTWGWGWRAVWLLGLDQQSRLPLWLSW